MDPSFNFNQYLDQSWSSGPSTSARTTGQARDSEPSHSAFDGVAGTSNTNPLSFRHHEILQNSHQTLSANSNPYESGADLFSWQGPPPCAPGSTMWQPELWPELASLDSYALAPPALGTITPGTHLHFPGIASGWPFLPEAGLSTSRASSFPASSASVADPGLNYLIPTAAPSLPSTSTGLSEPYSPPHSHLDEPDLLAGPSAPNNAEAPKLFSTDEERWEAVLSRNPLADGQFLYCVTTTQIYCRPTCASRRPSRANVAFATTVAEAEALRCRPCKRCKPTDSEDPTEKRRNDAIERLKRALLDPSAETKVTVKSVAEEMGVSMWHLNRTFKKKVGMPPQQWAQEMKRTSKARAVDGPGPRTT